MTFLAHQDTLWQGFVADVSLYALLASASLAVLIAFVRGDRLGEAGRRVRRVRWGTLSALLCSMVFSVCFYDCISRLANLIEGLGGGPRSVYTAVYTTAFGSLVIGAGLIFLAARAYATEVETDDPAPRSGAVEIR